MFQKTSGAKVRRQSTEKEIKTQHNKFEKKKQAVTGIGSTAEKKAGATEEGDSSSIQESDVSSINKLSRKLFSGNFEKLLSAQINALTKNKRGRRYSTNFKKFALSLYFCSPQNYRNLVKEFALPSVRSLQFIY